MNDKKQNRPSGSEIAADILKGATEALSYTDEEILATLPHDEAREFIELRNRVLGEMDDTQGEYLGNKDATPLAAEEETQYE